jgi:hypothetical protein
MTLRCTREDIITILEHGRTHTLSSYCIWCIAASVTHMNITYKINRENLINHEILYKVIDYNSD